MKTLLNLPRRPYVRLAVLSATASLVAYLLADAVDFASAAVAGLTALIAVRPTFHETASEVLRQVTGTVLGAAFGLGIVTQYGFTPALMFVMVLFCFILARYLKLGEEGAAVMGLTVILVMGPLDEIDLVAHRFVGVVIGTLIALIASLWVRPGKPHHRALTEALTQTDHSAEILLEISEYLAEHDGIVERAKAKEWTARAEANMIAIGQTRVDAESALAASKWSPLIDKEDAEAVVKQIQLASVTARTVYNMCNSLKVATSKGDQLLAGDIAANVADVLAATATVISGQTEAAQENPAEQLSAKADPVQEFRLSRKAVLQEIRDMDDTQPMVLAGSLLRDAETISHILTADPTSPAADATVEPQNSTK